MRNFLSAREIGVLKEAHHAAMGRKNADRIKTILLLNEGYSYKQIAKILLLDQTTTRRYEKEFKKGGIDQLVENNYSGSESFLSIFQKQELIAYLKDHTLKTVKEIIVLVEKTYDRTYAINHLNC